MDRQYYWRIGSYLTPEQIRHEENGRNKIRQLYGMSKTGRMGTFIGVGPATFLNNIKVAIQNGSFERDIPMCWYRGKWSIIVDPNLSDYEKEVQWTKFSQEYKAKLENDSKPNAVEVINYGT